MPDEQSLAIVKAAVAKRVSYSETYEQMLSAKVEEFFRDIAGIVSNNPALMRGEQIVHRLRLNALDVTVQGQLTRLSADQVFDRLHDLFFPLGVSVNLTDDREVWERGHLEFNIYIHKSQ